MATKKVIDVSKWNGKINWTAVASQVDAAIIRCGYRGYGKAGTLTTDSTFKENIEGAIKAGLPVGVYWCSQAISDQEALDEAAYCYKLIRSYKIEYPVYLDSEIMETSKASGRADRLSKARRTQYGLTFCRAMRDYGYTVGLYCSESWYTDEIDGAAFEKNGFETWVAKYSSIKPRMSCDAWQYTSTGKVSGVSGGVDLSHFYKNYASDELTPTEITFENAVKDIGLTSPDYWKAVLAGKKTATAGTIKALMDKYHAALTRK